MTILYIAGSAAPENLPRARAAMDAARALGFTIASDWVTIAERAGKRDADLDDDERSRLAMLCEASVQGADLLWLLVPVERGGRGSWVELGIARGCGIETIASGADVRATIFTARCRRVFGTDAGALGWLGAMGKATP